MGRKRFKTRRALLSVFLFTFIALAIIQLLVRRSPIRLARSNDGFFEIDASEWALPAIVLVVSLSGVSAWVILIKANR